MRLLLLQLKWLNAFIKKTFNVILYVVFSTWRSSFLFKFVFGLIVCFNGTIVSKSYVKWRGTDCIGEDWLSWSVCVCRERAGEERSANCLELLRLKLCGITVLVSLMQYSWLVLCKSFLYERKCSKMSNFWHDKFLNLIIPAAAFLITSFLAQLNQFIIFFRYIIFLVVLLLLLQLIWVLYEFFEWVLR